MIAYGVFLGNDLAPIAVFLWHSDARQWADTTYHTHRRTVREVDITLPTADLVCHRCPRYTGLPSPPGTCCPGGATCLQIACNNGQPITMVKPMETE